MNIRILFILCLFNAVSIHSQPDNLCKSGVASKQTTKQAISCLKISVSLKRNNKKNYKPEKWKQIVEQIKQVAQQMPSSSADQAFDHAIALVDMLYAMRDPSWLEGNITLEGTNAEDQQARSAEEEEKELEQLFNLSADDADTVCVSMGITRNLNYDQHLWDQLVASFESCASLFINDQVDQGLNALHRLISNEMQQQVVASNSIHGSLHINLHGNPSE